MFRRLIENLGIRRLLSGQPDGPLRHAACGRKRRAVAATAGMQPAVAMDMLEPSSARHAACVGNPRAGLHRWRRTQRRFV